MDKKRYQSLKVDGEKDARYENCKSLETHAGCDKR